MDEIIIDRYKEQFRIIGLNIANCREYRGYTQEELAREVGCSAELLNKIENNTASPHDVSLLLLLKICDALYTNLSFLFDGRKLRPKYYISILGWNKNQGRDSAQTYYYNCLEQEDMVAFLDDVYYARIFDSPEDATLYVKKFINALVSKYELNGYELSMRKKVLERLEFEARICCEVTHNVYDETSSIADIVYDINSMTIVDEKTGVTCGNPFPQEYLSEDKWKIQSEDTINKQITPYRNSLLTDVKQIDLNAQ